VVCLVPCNKPLRKKLFVHAKSPKVVGSEMAMQKMNGIETAFWRTNQSIGLIVNKLIL
jgi:hypothetical protein